MEEERNKPETVKHKYTEKEKEPEPEHHMMLILKHTITFPIMLTNREGLAFDFEK
jgi:hypothetical protein